MGQFEHFCKEIATRLSDGPPNPPLSIAPYTPGAKEQGGDKKWSAVALDALLTAVSRISAPLFF